jgi:hypothetical protein
MELKRYDWRRRYKLKRTRQTRAKLQNDRSCQQIVREMWKLYAEETDPFARMHIRNDIFRAETLMAMAGISTPNI